MCSGQEAQGVGLSMSECLHHNRLHLDVFDIPERHCGHVLLQGKQWDQGMPSHRQLAPQLRAALTRIHQHGIVHNDVKAENILVEQATGRPVFVDFGLAEHSLNEDLYALEDDGLGVMLTRAEWVSAVLLAGSRRLTS